MNSSSPDPAASAAARSPEAASSSGSGTGSAASGSTDIGTHTTRDFDDAAPVVLLVPLGSTEQHGPHLPLDTDTRIAVAVAAAVAENHDAVNRDAVMVAPPLAWGASGEHQGFAGTLSIGHEALHLVLVELARSVQHASWVRGLVFVNGHGGNQPGLAKAVAQLTDEGHTVAAWAPRVPHGDAHAGHTETSLMLHLAPETVRLSEAEPGRTEPMAKLGSQLIAEGVKGVSPNGVLGDPTGASAEVGAEIFASLVASLAAVVRQLAEPRVS